MHANIKILAQKILEVCDEIQYYEDLKNNLNLVLDKLYKDYQSQKISTKTYNTRISQILKGKTRLYWNKYYDSINYSLLKKIEYFNSQIFYFTYHDETEQKITLQEKVPEIKETKEKEIEIRGPVAPVTEENLPSAEESKSREIILSPEIIPRPEIKIEKPSPVKGVTKEVAPKEIKQKVPLAFEEKKRAPELKEIEDKQKIKYPVVEEPTAEIKLPKTSLLNQIKAVLSIKPKSPIAEASDVKLARKGLTMKKLSEDMEAHKREFKSVKKPMKIGKLASPFSRRITNQIINKYPNFFRKIFNSLRQANIPVLSHTYINVMIFFSLMTTIIIFPIFAIIFFLLGNTTLQIIIKSLIISVLVGIITFLAFYYYPQSKANIRKKNIKANLPFAVNHISAIASAGIEPTRMFKILAKSKDYGDVSSEFEKIVEYVEIFGYDILTAIKSAANTTPSKELKEFLDGFMSTVESGGDLQQYLKQKADEYAVLYDLERKKYIDLISTMSDVYTGIMMAAPLFLIVTLSLIGILGGKLFGMPIQTVILLGAYILIPMFNIIFMIFLNVTQPK